MKAIDRILNYVNAVNHVHANNLREYILSCTKDYIEIANWYLGNYIEFLYHKGFDFDFIVDSYLKMASDILVEQTRFLRSGKYRYKSIEEVEKNIYGNEIFMTKYMIGVALSQFLWENHKEMFQFFKNHMSKKSNGRDYLEIGPGHGFFFIEALRSKVFDKYTVVDISKTSLELTSDFVIFSGYDHESIHYINSNIISQRFDHQYDFITCGEVLEHLEEPQTLLGSIHKLLSLGGRAYISTCANCPVIDHIFLYRSIDEIRISIEEVGLTIEEECMVSNDKIPKDLWLDEKSNVSYACIVSK